MNAHEQTCETLTRIFGEHRGLNADWAVQAWPVGGRFWILDNEDGTFSSVERIVTDDGEQQVNVLSTSFSF